MNLVMLNFHYRLKTKKKEHFIKFINDEVAFFTETFYSQFEFLSRNLRKMNGGILLTAQDIQALVIKEDSFLVSHTDYKFLFEQNGLTESLINKTMGNNSNLFEKISRLKSSKGHYSNFLLSDTSGVREGYLRLSPHEYYTSSTFSGDNLVLEKLKSEFKLNENQSIELLANLHKFSEVDGYAL